MPSLPEKKEIPGKKALRNILFAIGIFFGLAAYGYLQSGEGGSFMVCAMIAGAAVYSASKVKTHLTLTRYGGVYEKR